MSGSLKPYVNISACIAKSAHHINAGARRRLGDTRGANVSENRELGAYRRQSENLKLIGVGSLLGKTASAAALRRQAAWYDKSVS